LKKKYGNLDSKIVSYIAYEFQEAVVETLWKKLLKAAKFFGISNIAITGWVSANSRLREFILDNKQKYWIENFYTPAKLVYSTDNAAMIGVVGLLNKIAF
jgi:N6-L-threonylcarbamoyladenine synthase